MKENNNLDIDDFGFKTTSEGDEYIIYHFIDVQDLTKNNSTLKDCYKELIDTDKDDNISVSSSYKNENGLYEADPFANRSIGFIIDDGYKIKHMFKKNIMSEKTQLTFDNNKRLTETEIKDYFDDKKNRNENEINFLNHLKNSDTRWKKILNSAIQKAKQGIKKGDNIKFEFTDDFMHKYYNEKADLTRYTKDKYLSINDKDECRAYGNGKRIKVDIDRYKTENKYQQCYNDIINNNFCFSIENNEWLIQKNQKHLGVKSLFVNISEKSEETRNFHQRYYNTRKQRLEEIATNMNDIVNMQLDTFNHINIPFRDERNKEITFPTLYEFAELIKDMCKQEDLNIPDNYPKLEDIIFRCKSKIEEKFQNKINDIFGKKKKCFFNDNSHKLLNERSSYWKHSLFIGRINECYNEILKSRDKNLGKNATDIDKMQYYIDNMTILFNAISKYEQLHQGEEEKIENSLSKNSLLSIKDKQLRC